ncbi:hypothetical protein DFH11DRAFT_1731751 [Phellopilus nigrolimitatus]|nr:hypothetical protein DFH11DRAFT_1731751 [Phellopilus nigrolimitatus]
MSAPSSPLVIDSAAARKIIELIRTAVPVSNDLTLRDTLFDISSGKRSEPYIPQEGTHIAKLLKLLAPILISPPSSGGMTLVAQATHPANRNPCYMCKKHHQGCIIVSQPDAPMLCERCKGRGWSTCAPKDQPAPVPQPGTAQNVPAAFYTVPHAANASTLVFDNQYHYGQQVAPGQFAPPGQSIGMGYNINGLGGFGSMQFPQN